jgi:hypothetical protein
MTIALFLKGLCSGAVGRNPKFQLPIKQGHHGVGRALQKGSYSYNKKTIGE